jgi:hypothetical protein
MVMMMQNPARTAQRKVALPLLLNVARSTNTTIGGTCGNQKGKMVARTGLELIQSERSISGGWSIDGPLPVLGSMLSIPAACSSCPGDVPITERKICTVRTIPEALMGHAHRQCSGAVQCFVTLQKSCLSAVT